MFGSRSAAESSEEIGLITYVDEERALVWIKGNRREKELDIRYRSWTFAIGDWIQFRSTGTIVRSEEPQLDVRIIGDGIVQVKTRVIFDERKKAARIAHGLIVHSSDFGPVAIFAPYKDSLVGQTFNLYVERIPVENSELSVENNVYWFIPPKEVPVPNAGARDMQYMDYCFQNTITEEEITDTYEYVGVVVSIFSNNIFVWNPAIGEGLCNKDKRLSIGDWIKFNARPEIVKKSVNLTYRVTTWAKTTAELPSKQIRNTIMLRSMVTIYDKDFNIENLCAKWVGTIIDRNGILKREVRARGAPNTFEIVLLRMKKSSDEPIAMWNVDAVLDVKEPPRPVCFVDFIFTNYVGVIANYNSKFLDQRLYYPSEIFQQPPKMGNWYELVMEEKKIVSAHQIGPILKTRLKSYSVEVETSLRLSEEFSKDQFPVALSDDLGKVVDEVRAFDCIKSGINKFWCLTRPKKYENPLWRVSVFSYPNLQRKNGDNKEIQKMRDNLCDITKERYKSSSESNYSTCTSGEDENEKTLSSKNISKDDRNHDLIKLNSGGPTVRDFGNRGCEIGSLIRIFNLIFRTPEIRETIRVKFEDEYKFLCSVFDSEI